MHIHSPQLVVLESTTYPGTTDEVLLPMLEETGNREVGQTRIRSVLGAFLFSGDDVDKTINVLSGGERARVALARLLVKPGNLLLLDEPTNHLDLDSCESLIESLSDYGGTMVFVSHNRALVRRLATKIWVVDGGTVTEYPGNLDDYNPNAVTAPDSNIQ